MQRLEAWMRQNRVTNAALAEALGVSINTVTCYRRPLDAPGATRPRARRARALEQFTAGAVTVANMDDDVTLVIAAPDAAEAAA